MAEDHPLFASPPEIPQLEIPREPDYFPATINVADVSTPVPTKEEEDGSKLSSSTPASSEAEAEAEADSVHPG